MVAENNFPNDCCLEFLQFTGCTVKIEKVKSKFLTCLDLKVLRCNDFQTVYLVIWTLEPKVRMAKSRKLPHVQKLTSTKCCYHHHSHP